MSKTKQPEKVAHIKYAANINKNVPTLCEYYRASDGGTYFRYLTREELEEIAKHLNDANP